jgi:hypothetical protein
MELTVKDTILYVAKPVDRTIPKAIYPKPISKRKEVKGRNGRCVVRVDKEEVDRLWR